MAVTQQIVRISHLQLNDCSNDPQRLNELISFKLTEPEDEIDLNWAPAGMELYFKKSEQLHSVRKALKLVLDGEALLYEHFPSGPIDDSVDSDITFLSSPKVIAMANEFESINWTNLYSCMPRNKIDAFKSLSCDLTCHPDEYYLPEIKKLVAFVKQAAKQNMALVQWWN